MWTFYWALLVACLVGWLHVAVLRFTACWQGRSQVLLKTRMRKCLLKRLANWFLADRGCDFLRVLLFGWS